MIKAIIFDLDGVLVNAKDWHFEALNRALGKFGYVIARDDHLAVFDGLPTRRKLEILTAQKGLPAEHYNAIFDLKQHFTMELIERLCMPYPPHEHALGELRKRGYRLAVASNSTRATVDSVLRLTKLSHFIEFSLSNTDVQQPKPHPEIYRKAIRQFGLTPEDCLIIEDNIKGIKAAEASGAQVMVVETIHDVNLARIMASLEPKQFQERA